MYRRKNKRTNLSEYIGPNLDTAGCHYNLEDMRVNIPVVRGEVVKHQSFQKIDHVGTVRVAPGYHQAAPNTRTTAHVSPVYRSKYGKPRWKAYGRQKPNPNKYQTPPALGLVSTH